MPEEFNLGDTVRMKSGGPTMTVAGPEMSAVYVAGQESKPTGKLVCRWFHENKVMEDVFWPAEIEKARL